MLSLGQGKIRDHDRLSAEGDSYVCVLVEAVRPRAFSLVRDISAPRAEAFGRFVSNRQQAGLIAAHRPAIDASRCVDHNRRCQ